MERQRQRQRIGECVGDAVCLEEGGDLPLAAESSDSFGDVEHQIPTFPAAKAGHQVFQVSNGRRRMARLLERSSNRLDRIGAVELGRFLFLISLRQVAFAEIIRDAYLHEVGLLPSAAPATLFTENASWSPLNVSG